MRNKDQCFFFEGRIRIRLLLTDKVFIEGRVRIQFSFKGRIRILVETIRIRNPGGDVSGPLFVRVLAKCFPIQNCIANIPFQVRFLLHISFTATI